MHYGCCLYTLIPCRADASDKSEQVNQLLFGECYEVLEFTPKWIRIRTTVDQYVAWIDSKLHTQLSETELIEFQNSKKTVVQYALQPIFNETLQTQILLTYGCSIPDSQSAQWSIGPYTFQTLSSANPSPAQTIAELARGFLGAPYLWGGKSLFGIDCSGFTQVVFRSFGANLPRDAYQQVELGVKIEINQIQSGDLAFFNNDVGRVTHVGICLTDGEIIHCAGRCRIDTLDEQGILNLETNQYSHQLHSIKRL